MMERTLFPRFDGNQENWVEFKRLFKELMRVMEMAQLASKLLSEAKGLIARIQNPNNA